MTTDERLAALEAKLDALTAPPSDYYTSRYSGEEIDAAIAAVPGKAETAQLCNRNLLDNWYFGNPVDQRGGYVVLPGTTYYDNTWTAVGTTTGYIKIDSIIPTGGAWITIGGTQYLVSAPSDSVVRGYVGAGYTVDRWKLFGSAHVVTIEAKSITLRKPANTVDFVYAQYFEGATLEFLRGKTVTISAMDSNGNVYSKTLLVPASGMFDSDNLYIGDNWWIDLIVLPSGDFYIRFVSITKAETTLGIQAAKLELGSQQTLAHQDADGNWVLNEVPDYGEQLRRCQRYFLKIGDVSHYCSLGNGVARDAQNVSITIPTPVTMRTVPGLIAIPAGFTMRHSDTLISDGANFSVDASSQNSIMLKIQSQVALTPGDMWEAFLSPNGSIMFSADL